MGMLSAVILPVTVLLCEKSETGIIVINNHPVIKRNRFLIVIILV